MKQRTRDGLRLCDEYRPCATTISRLIKVDGELGIELPEDIVVFLALKDGAEVTLEVRDGALLITPSSACT